MRTFEILISITLAIYILWPFFAGKENPLFITLLPILSATLIGFHLLIEGYRWQMFPLYALVGIILLSTLLVLFHPATGEFKRLSWNAVSQLIILILLGGFTALPFLIPVPNVPVPSGPYPVGIQTFVLTDYSRLELYSGQDEPRKFMLQVWYPALPKPDSPHAPWMNNASIYTREIANYLKLPPFFLDHLKLVKTPAFQDAQLELSGCPYPVLIFSHGWSGFAAQNTGQALELASHGYVVVGVQHTYGAVVTVFPDGKIAYNNPHALPDGLTSPEYELAARKLADQWAGDIAYTLDFLETESRNENGPFYSTLNLELVGVFGHSTGAGAAIQFCGTDARCKSVLGMDPFMTPVSESVLENGLSQPAFFMFSQIWVDDIDSKNNRLFNQLYKNLDPSTHVIGIQGTKHYDFSDLPMLSPLAPQLGLKGPLKGKKVIKITNTYLINFFNLTLKAKPTDLFNGQSHFSEIIVLH